MKLEFKVCELTESYGIEISEENEFIIVGEDKIVEDHYLVHQIIDGELRIINGFNIQESAYVVPKEIVKIKGPGWYTDCYEFEIDEECLNMQIVQEIQRLNE